MTNEQQSKPSSESTVTYHKVVFEREAHQELLKGADILANAVRSTIGPSGHSVIIDLGPGRVPLITKDGISVARSINLKERLPAMGADLLREVSAKTNELCGDGSSQSVVLGHSLLKNGIKMIATGRSSVELKRGMDIGTDIVIQFLKAKAIPVSGKEDIVNIGTISANGDRELGELIAEAIEKVGKDGIVTIEPSKSIHTTLNIVEGLQLDNGYSSPFFITNSDKATAVFEKPYILVTNNKISALKDLVPAMEIALKAERPLLVIAEDVDAEALHALIVNKTKGILPACVVRAPSYGEFRADLLGDVSKVVGGEMIGATSTTSLSQIKESHLGSCSKVIVSRTNCTIVVDDADKARKEQIEAHIEDLRSVLENDSTLDLLRSSKIRQRLAKLSGGIAVIHVGGSTEVEIKEKKDRVEDAVNATIAASQEGIVPGGGAALFYAAQFLKTHLKLDSFYELSPDTKEGIMVIAEACEAPFRAIIGNTAYSPDVAAQELMASFKHTKNITKLNFPEEKREKFVRWSLPEELNAGKILTDQQFRFGFNASNGTYADLVAEGIVDPVKVTRHAIQHASSVMGLMLVCNACVVNSDD